LERRRGSGGLYQEGFLIHQEKGSLGKRNQWLIKRDGGFSQRWRVRARKHGVLVRGRGGYKER